MNERKAGKTQSSSAAKAGISERSARRIDNGELTVGPLPARHWRTRQDPLSAIWDTVLVPMLEQNPGLLPITVFEFLCDNYPGQYDDKILRTLQRRIKGWKAISGPDKEVMFRQAKEPGRLGLSDFTLLKGITITIKKESFSHRLYHYRLAFSGWCYVKVICGGESYTALSTGLQNALWRCGGAPLEHRTDSLSAAFNNQHEKELLTKRYQDLCRHYGVKPTRNTVGKSHENGAVESPHGHLKRRITQAFLLRGSYDFDSLEDYQSFIDRIVSKINQRCGSRFKEESHFLQALPARRTHDYSEYRVMISSSSTFSLKRVLYTVPSRFIGERLYVQLFDNEIKLFFGHQFVLALPRLYTVKAERKRCVDYRHVIGSLVRKPQAFRYSALRDDLLPSPDYHLIWQTVDDKLEPHKACRYIVRLLHLAAEHDCEGALGRYVLSQIEQGELPSELDCQKKFAVANTVIPLVANQQHCLNDYDQLISSTQQDQEVCCYG